MATHSKASLELKRLREHAGYSIRQLAAALRETGSDYGKSPSSYVYYENSYKKSYLPVDLVDALAPLLVDRGTPPIGERQVLALAGLPRQSLWKIRPTFTEKLENRTKSDIESELLAEIMQRIDVEKEALSLRLDGRQTAQLVAEVYNRIIAMDSMSRPGMVDWEVAHACRIAKAVLQSGH